MLWCLCLKCIDFCKLILFCCAIDYPFEHITLSPKDIVEAHTQEHIVPAQTRKHSLSFWTVFQCKLDTSIVYKVDWTGFQHKYSCLTVTKNVTTVLEEKRAHHVGIKHRFIHKKSRVIWKYRQDETKLDIAIQMRMQYTENIKLKWIMSVINSLFVCVQLAQSLAKAIGEASSNLVQNVSFVIITQSPGNFIIGHTGSVSVFSPQGSEGLSITEAEQPLLLVLPRHHVLILGLLDHTQGKFPELRWSRNIWKWWREEAKKSKCNQCLIGKIHRDQN